MNDPKKGKRTPREDDALAEERYMVRTHDEPSLADEPGMCSASSMTGNRPRHVTQPPDFVDEPERGDN